MIIGLAAGVLILLGLWIWLKSGVVVGKSRLSISHSEVHFPTVTGSNLMREEYEFPRDFPGDLNLLLIPFQQWQQREVNTWLPAVQGLEATLPGLYYFELPTIYELPALSRTFINEGMRAGIPDQTARERTITLYLDKEAFKQALGILSEETITVILVDQAGSILWRETGTFSESKFQSLTNKLSELRSSPLPGN